MNNYPAYFNNEEELEEALSRPSGTLIAMMRQLEGDLIFLGVAGKMGISMARMAKRACDQAGIEKRIIGVSRFSNPQQKKYLEAVGVETLQGDLLDRAFVDSLPKTTNVVYLAGMKFGASGNEPYTWAMNSFLPGIVADKYKKSRIIALSTGCVYPLVNVNRGGSKEDGPPGPVGEYAQSCLGRERLFEYGCLKYGTPTVLIRLNYAVEMRYGVLVDIATKVHHGQEINLTMGYANVIWQGDANDMILRSFAFCQAPATVINISGSEVIKVRDTALKLGLLMDKPVSFKGSEDRDALLVNVTKARGLLGSPRVPLEQVINWTAHWVNNGHRLLGKPTHFEVRDGKF